MATGRAYETCGDAMKDNFLDYAMAVVIGLAFALIFVTELSK